MAKEDIRNKFEEETGGYYYDSSEVEFKWNDDYVEWLEKQLALHNVVGQSEQLKAKLDNVSELAKNFINEVDKKHPFVSLPQDEDFYMARHRLAEKLI